MQCLKNFKNYQKCAKIFKHNFFYDVGVKKAKKRLNQAKKWRFRAIFKVFLRQGAKVYKNVLIGLISEIPKKDIW